MSYREYFITYGIMRNMLFLVTEILNNSSVWLYLCLLYAKDSIHTKLNHHSVRNVHIYNNVMMYL